MTENKIAIFDLDGTVLDTLEDLCDGVNHILIKYGFAERTVEEVRSFVGNGSKKLMERSLPNGVNEETFLTCYGEFVEYYREHANIKTRPYKDIVHTLESLSSKGILCAVVTNKPHRAAVELCAEYFGDLIVETVGDSSDRPRKPDPLSVLDVIKKYNACKAVYVGDSEVDIMTAKNADIPCISVTWGFKDKDFLLQNGAACTVSTAAELYEKILDRLGVADGETALSEGGE